MSHKCFVGTCREQIEGADVLCPAHLDLLAPECRKMLAGTIGNRTPAEWAGDAVTTRIIAAHVAAVIRLEAVASSQSGELPDPDRLADGLVEQSQGEPTKVPDIKGKGRAR